MPYDIRVKENAYFSFEWSNQSISNQDYEAILPQGYNYFFFCQLERQVVALKTDQKRLSGMEKPSRLDIFNNKVSNHLLFGGHYLNDSVCFKLRDSLYMIRGTRFDRYDIKEDKYHENITVSIPSDVYWITGAVVDLNQTHAFLVTKNGLRVFTEENRFECFASDFIPFLPRHSGNFVPCTKYVPLGSGTNLTMFCIG